MIRVGFIGCGNMARAIIGGIIKAELVGSGDIIASDTDGDALQKAATDFSITTTDSNQSVAEQIDFLFLAVKPHQIIEVIEEIRTISFSETVVASIAAGVNLKAMEEAFQQPVRLARLMPNTPALVGEGMTAVCPNKHVSEENLQTLLALLSGIGSCEVVPEAQMDAVVAVSGSSPAYVYMFIEALADGAVREGMPRAAAYRFAAQAVLGSAKMVLESGRHPGELKDMVCSPAGTTIEAVAELEKNGFRNSVLEAMRVCAAKNRNM